jgi:hypothetical protein
VALQLRLAHARLAPCGGRHLSQHARARDSSGAAGVLLAGLVDE